MNKFYSALSSPDSPSPSSQEQYYDDSALEGVAANVKLLLKLIQDHKDACKKEKRDGRRMLRVATMMTILDNVRTRIQKCQSFGCKRSESATELQRRSYPDLRAAGTHAPPAAAAREKRPSWGNEAAAVEVDENVRLRKELNASVAARKRLEVMCSSLGKEKEIMTKELSRKAHELNEMEELISDLKAQNRTLLDKVHECASEHKHQTKPIERGEDESEEEPLGDRAFEGQNRTVSEQKLQRVLKELQGENNAMRATMEEMGEKISAGLNRIRSFKEKNESSSSPSSSSSSLSAVDIREEILQLEHMFECFEMKVSKQVKGECGKPNGDIIAAQPSVLA